ncbi:MAG: TauD/TfdA family dioxygenase [Methylococcus sp.]|nr:TauD/TfdA family dioxygenase [Methylococcus sp.]
MSTVPDLYRANPPLRHLPNSAEIEPTGGALGAFVSGIDASLPVDPATLLKLRQALNDHHILIFSGQNLSDEEFLRLATYFGAVFIPPEDVPVLASDNAGKTPDIIPIANVEGGYTGNGELHAHIDHQWTPYPSAGSLLYALEVPETGGDTIWINLALAYGALDEATKRLIDGLQLITYNPFKRKPGDPRPRYRLDPNAPPSSEAFPHPLVRTHPESGRKLLYLSAATEVEIVGWEPQEGAALIERLRAHLADPRFAYRHHWSVGDIVFWDNQATVHARTPFPAESRRVLKRVSLAGGRPF